MATTAAITSSNEPMMDLEAGEQTPLVGGGGGETKYTELPPLKDMKAESYKETVVTGVAGVGFTTSLLALIFQSSGNPTVLISGLLGAGLAPYAAFQQRKLTQVEALQQVNEFMDAEMEQLAAENERLAAQVRQMTETIRDLSTIRETLAEVQSVQGASVADLEKQLEDSRTILKAMDDNYEGQILQNLTVVMLAADRDGNGKLNDEEIEHLIHQLENINNVDLNDELLKKTIAEHDGDIFALMDVARNLMEQDIPDEENIFKFSKNQSQEE